MLAEGLSASQSISASDQKWRYRAIGILRIAFGFIWAFAAWLKWQPAFQASFLDQVSGAKDGQPALIQGWISFWSHLVSLNPLLFGRVEASLETALAVALIFGVFSNLTYFVGFFLSLGIWSTAEGFGGPYKLGESTDIGTALPYALIFALLFAIAAGRYYGWDRWLAPRLGRFKFLAS
jgi:nitrite reductase (NO-forming)